MNTANLLSINIREAIATDILSLETLVNLAYRGGKATVAWKNENHLVVGPRATAAGLQEQVSSPDTTILVSEADEHLSGCVLIEKKGENSHIGMLSVHPEMQNLGLGKMLITKAEEYAREQFHSKNAIMFVLSGRPELLGWYEKLGYSQTGKTAPFPNNPAIGLQPLSADAHFCVISKALTLSQ